MDSGLRIRLRRLRALAGDAVGIGIKSIRIGAHALEVPFRQFVAVPILLRLMDTDVGVFRRAGAAIAGYRIVGRQRDEQIDGYDEAAEIENVGSDGGKPVGRSRTGVRDVLRQIAKVHSFTITAARANRG